MTKNKKYTIKEFLTKEAGNPAYARNYKKQFAAVMLESIMPDTINGEDFLRITQEVFPKNAIAKKISIEMWDKFTFKSVVYEVTGQ